MPILERSGLQGGRDFLLAYSPERIDPGNDEFDLRNTPKIVGGVSAESTGVAVLFYGQLVDKVVPVSSCRTAELSKLLENTFRHVNIALVNEIAILCHEVGHRRVGGRRCRLDQTVRVHDLLPGSRRGRALHPARSDLPLVADPA